VSTEQTLHRDAAAESLALARIAVFGMWLWNVSQASLLELGRLPVGLLEPLGPLRLLPAAAWAVLCSPPALLALQACLIVCLVALVLGVGPFRAIAALTCALLVVEQGIVRAVGYMTHGEFTMLYAAIVLAAFPCNDALALRPPRHAHAPRDPVLYRAPLVACGLTLCLTYALSAAHRFDAGGLGIFLDGTILSRVALRAAERGGLGLMAIEHPWLGWIASFQIAVSALMMISFRANLVLLAIFLTELPQLAGLWAAKRRRT